MIQPFRSQYLPLRRALSRQSRSVFFNRPQLLLFSVSSRLCISKFGVTLTTQQLQQKSKGKELLLGAAEELYHVGASLDDVNILRENARRLDELFMLVVIGEFNSGKSTLLNALLGKKYLRDGVTPTTDSINLIKYGKKEETLVDPDHKNTVIVRLPVDWLNEINVVDTPGTNAILRDHERITHHFIPNSDLVIFVTTVDRPFSESERKFIETIREWKKKVVLVVSKIDLLETDEELHEIVKFVQQSSCSITGEEFPIFTVSARRALRAKISTDFDDRKILYESSRFQELENFILNTLDPNQRMHLKLLGHIDVGSRLLHIYQKKVSSSLDLIKDDVARIQTIENQLSYFKKDMSRGMTFRLSRLFLNCLNLTEKQKRLSFSVIEH